MLLLEAGTSTAPTTAPLDQRRTVCLNCLEEFLPRSFSRAVPFFVAEELVAQVAGSRSRRSLPDDLDDLWVLQVAYILA